MSRDKPFIGDEDYMLNENNGNFVLKSPHKRQSVSLTVRRGKLIQNRVYVVHELTVLPVFCLPVSHFSSPIWI